jgi:cell wall-associated NlpC family hydrolase
VKRRFLAVFATAIIACAVITSTASASPAAAATAKRGHPHSAVYYAWHWALEQAGKPYAYGGTGPRGFDCSGLVYAAYAHARVHLPRTTYEMMADSRQLVRTSHPTTGDLVFFYGGAHVELYVNHSTTYGSHHDGTVVSDVGMGPDPVFYKLR